MRNFALLCFFSALLFGGLACQSEPLPLVMDRAGLLTDPQKDQLALQHQFLLLDYDIDYRVVTSIGSDDVDQAALELFESISAGASSTTGRGLLLLLDSEREEVRLEVGYSLEGVFPDAFIAYVEQRQMVPFFVEERISDGILASTELIVDRAERASRNASWDDEIWMKGSGGAGARSSTRQAPEFSTRPPSRPSDPVLASQRSPEDVVAAYLDAMSRRDNSPELDIYTDESRELLREWLVTPAQMDQVARAYKGCSQDQLSYSGAGDRAVIRYPIRQRQCAPWFLRHSAQGWQLDLTMLQSTIQFGRSNAWHFNVGRSHPYEFAFDDWNLDANGFPISRKNAD